MVYRREEQPPYDTRIATADHKGLLPKLGAATATLGGWTVTGTDPGASINPSGATPSLAGVLSAADKAKLDAQAVITGFNSPIILVGGAIGVQPATGGQPGYLAAADFTKLAATATRAFIAAGTFTGGTYTPDCANGDDQTIFLTLGAGGATLGFPANSAVGKRLQFVTQQDATGGRAFTFGSANYRRNTTGLSTAASTYTTYSFVCVTATQWVMTAFATGL